MPPKKKIPAPIDRPLSRSYLREFTGWSTAYPPGLSEPTSLRQMENILINRDGSARIRPGLRYLSYRQLPVEGGAAGLPIEEQPVSSHEAFYLNDGSKAYLLAVREDDGTVGFRVFSGVVHTLAWAGFTFDPDESSLHFTAATRYVKFLQIDNKIFALSDAGEPMRLFYVGSDKKAKLLQSITRPEWTFTDKLIVRHPDDAWVTSGTPLTTRINQFYFPSFEANLVVTPDSDYYVALAAPYTTYERSSDFAWDGIWSLKLQSRPQRTNLMTQPLYDLNTTGLGDWTEGPNALGVYIHAASNSLVIDGSPEGGPAAPPPPGGTRMYAKGPRFPVTENQNYRFAFDTRHINAGAKNTGIRLRWYDSGGTQIGADDDQGWSTAAVERRVITNIVAPSGATELRLLIGVSQEGGAGVAAMVRVNDLLLYRTGEGSSAMFHGGSGANYFWEGAVNDSSSLYHPPADVGMTFEIGQTDSDDYTFSGYFRSNGLARTVELSVSSSAEAPVGVADGAGAWVRVSQTFTCDPFLGALATFIVKAVPRGEAHYVDGVLFEKGAALGAYFDGSTPDGVGVQYDWIPAGVPDTSQSRERTYAGAATIPPAEVPTASTLISSDATKNTYSFGFFYTFSNEIGESAASQATIVKVQRNWSEWEWDGLADPALAEDQLVAILPQDVYDAAVAVGALFWTLYMFTWSNQDPVPVSALKVGVRRLDDGPAYGSHGWLAVTPAQTDYGTEANVLPSEANRYNFSNPSHGGQGIVAADRMVIVKDPTAAAVIRWTSNRQGEYINFSASKGGGYKTLTHGNLQIPAVVKLWQNPQSADTLTILTLGTDGHSTGYYMAPAQVASQSEAVNIMGFEETTATPGTTSPYGVEVWNNALFHPLDEQLMKSTASNYNINHKSMTEQIANLWRDLATKEWIISSQHDNRLYYIVNNPYGAELEEGCNGNELWVFDAQAEAGNWSRWLIQATSLRKLERQGQVHMSVVRPDGIYYLDEEYTSDDFVNAGEVDARSIPWYLETNTQGANRAHDAWAFLQQMDLVVGNFTGRLRWGLRGWDVNGKAVDVSKVLDYLEPVDRVLPWDVQDQLLIRRSMKEWFFYAGSEVDEDDNVMASEGQLNLVQYRYAPVSVNVGYEYGSVETFEYGRATANRTGELTNSGVPVPHNDQRQP